jgi:3-methyladenine DNA glycosylase AlkD
MQEIIEAIRNDLKENVDLKTLTTSQNFFKETIVFYGVRIPTVNRISKKYFRYVEQEEKSVIFAFCEVLWQSGFIEESFIACHWSHGIHKRYEPDDILVFGRWIENHVNNWASCDTLCNHTVGTFIEMFPQHLPRLKEFARSGNRWMRRAAAVTLIIAARKGKFLSEIFEIADILLRDGDDLVQKGYGWMLKAASEANQSAVFDYVMKNKTIMPRTSLRYAVEKMPKELRSMAMDRSR